MTALRAGAARIRLEPPLGLGMLGYGSRVGVAAGVHDDLAAQAIVIGEGEHKLALCGVDLLAIGKRIADEIRADVAAHSDIPADAILIGASHTHSGPAFNIFATPRADAKLPADRSLEWERALPAKIAAAIVAANSALEPAVLKTAHASFSLGTNRRLRRPDGRIQLAANYAGVADSHAQGIGLYRPDGSAIGLLLNYPCHGVVLCEDNLLYSRDWMGFALDELEAHADRGATAPPIAIFMQGATGNIDPRSRGSFEVAAEYGHAAGRAIAAALAAATVSRIDAIRGRGVELVLKLKPLGDAIAVARAGAAQTEASLAMHRGGGGYQLKRLRDHHQQSLGALRALETLEEANRRDQRANLARGELAAGMSVFAIGDLAIVAIPGEAFVEFGLALRANPYFAHTIVACYCNDLIGYIPTRESYPLGGYEVETARVAEGAGEAIVAAAIGVMRELRAAAPA
ncbi:MAG TPA: neutral/alkaline non-lysosomal ceramidase N-terminal domain-containing protein [Candidatus Binataceae bacterium]|nr:neutral/alkaline non-lysosomal ceramidase N-terminal domain-containing protein [Candidatus Binataceae bacterium]